MNLSKLVVIAALFTVFLPAYAAEKNKNKKIIIKQQTSGKDSDLLQQLAIVLDLRMKEQLILCCNNSFTMKELITHYTKNHFLNSSECPTCQQQFSSPHNAAYHYAAVHEKTTIFACPKCNHNYHQENSLKKHYVSCVNGHKRRKHSSKREEAYLHLHKNIQMIPELAESNFTWENIVGYVTHDQENGGYRCMVLSCKNLFGQKKQAASCYLKHFNQKIFSCPSCSHTMNDMDGYLNHVTNKCPHNYTVRAKNIIKKYQQIDTRNT